MDGFGSRVELRRNWRGAESALRFAQRASGNRERAIKAQVQMLAALGRVEEAEALVKGETADLGWETYADAGMLDRARELAEAALPNLRKAFEALEGSTSVDTVRVRHEGVRSRLVAAEIILGHRDIALSLLDGWQKSSAKLTPNRRSGGASILLPRFYAELGEAEMALGLLRQAMADGRSLGYELRDTPSFAALRDYPGFLDLRRQAEAWASLQPDPVDDPIESTAQVR
jgi:tetratricopeptide (TPR) repeat protein